MVTIYSNYNEGTCNTFKDFLSLFNRLLDSSGYGAVMTGTVARWDGAYPGGCHIKTADDIWPFLEDCDNITVFDEDGRLCIAAAHHDGTNYAEIRLLTQKGADWYEEYELRMHKKELLQSLFTDDSMSTCPNLIGFAFGYLKNYAKDLIADMEQKSEMSADSTTDSEELENAKREDTPMKFFIGEDGGTGLEYTNIQDFLDAISDLAATYEENGEECFEIQIVS